MSAQMLEANACLTLEPMRGDRTSVLADTFFSIEKLYGGSISDLNIREIHMQSPYTIVELTDGSQGVAFNFDHQLQPFKVDDDNSGEEAVLPRATIEGKERSSQVAVVQKEPRRERRNWAAISAELLDESKMDNLLIKTLLTNTTPKKHYELSAQVAILNTLSQKRNLGDKYLRGEGLILKDYPVPLASFSRTGDVISVIGLGTYFYQALYDPNVQMLLLSDSLLGKSSEMRARIGKFLEHFPNKLEFYDAVDSESLILESDIACIDASALSNGTMDGLLRAARDGKCREVIVHGHGGGILSAPLFERGVTMHVPKKLGRGFLSEAKTFLKKRQLPILSEVRTVLEEENFYDFIDVKSKSVTISAKPISFGRAKQFLNRKVINRFWAS